MAAKSKDAVTYVPSQKEREYMHHCIKLGLIKLSLSRAKDYKDEYYIAKFDDSVFPSRTTHFLKNFSLPETPSNKAVFTEFEGLKKIFEIYKEFYMRNTNISEEVIKTDYQESKKEEEKKKIVEDKKQKQKKEKKMSKEEKMLNFPHKQIDLFEMIADCEKENESKD